MRDQYSGDVSDYLKYALLRTLADDKKLAVGWYYLSGRDGRPDGRHDEYLRDPQWAALDPALFEHLKNFRNSAADRSIAAVERLPIWPSQTEFHRSEVPTRKTRAQWLQGLLETARRSELVFVDPDNGISTEGKWSRKSATWSEIFALSKTDLPLVVIRFPHRQSLHDAQLKELHQSLGQHSPVTLRTCVRIPTGPRTSTPRIRWFTLVNSTSALIEKLADFGNRLSALPNASCSLEQAT